MLNIRHILFPIDFSERCCETVPFVESMARQYNAKITLLSVGETPTSIASAEPGGPVAVNSSLVLNDLQAKLDGALAGEFRDLGVQRHVELGDPAQLIADYAHAVGVDLIMMPTRGCGVFRRLLIGSVTAKVLHDAQCPVWTSAHIADPNHANFLPYRSVLCAVDGGPKGAELIAWAGKFAHDAGATLRLIYVLQGMKDFPSPKYRDELREQAEAQIENLEEGLGFRAPLSVMFGLVGDCVRAEAMARVADVVIVGRGAIHDTLGGLRTHAFGIIRQSPCPVISV